ncbi:siderophore-interacting protein [Dyadobacter luteus]|uniref:Siderophore-interacting protein n=1 Tax=Dyadobacter luteus TaxID=2259619 RepID=A0A3D8YBM1_9BACT|nr:siderophore-interacting protein [Dyadobacter luteus]REA61524.1 siderophore-interacting protein [Dyadobacter luteus]
MKQTENKAPSPIQFDTIEVTAYKDVTPHMRSITFKGCRAASRKSLSPGAHVKVFLPLPGQDRPVLPTLDESGKVVHPPQDIKPIVRTYTLRSYNAETGEIQIDFVLHGDNGPASAWAGKVQPGDIIGLAYREGLASYTADHFVFGGDETALPAISGILENLPASATGEAWIEIAGPQEEQEIITESQVKINWLHRNETAAHGDLLINALLNVNTPDAGVKPYVWVAAEFETIKQLRNHFRENWNLDKSEHAVAYWKLDMDEDKFHDLRHQQMAEQK